MFKTTKKYETEITSVSDIPEKFGKYQILQYFYVSLPAVFVSMVNVNYIFVAGEVGYRCRIRECESLNTNYCVPWWPNHTDQCTKPVLNHTYIDNHTCTKNSFTGAIEQCTDWVYENHDTIVSKVNFVRIFSFSLEPKQGPNPASDFRVWRNRNMNSLQIGFTKVFNLMFIFKLMFIRLFSNNFFLKLNLACQPWKRTMVGTIHNIGMTISELWAGSMADIYGRKTIMIICALGCIIGNFKTLVYSYSVYISLEFLEALICGGVYTVAGVLMLEMAPKKNRGIAGVVLSYGIYLGEALFALVGMLVPYWKSLINIICSPPILFILYFILVNESPRWLILKGKTSQTKKTFKKMIEMNKLNVDIEELSNIDDNKLKAIFNLGQSETKQGIKQVFQCRHLIMWVLIISFSRFTVGFTYYGLLVNSVVLPGDKYTNFLLAALMSFPGELLSLLLMNKFGRRLPLILGFLLFGLSFIASGYIPANYVWLKICLFLFTKIVASACYTGTSTYAMELYPTSVRGVLMGLCTVSSSLGNMLAPLSPLLSPWMASILFGCLAIISSALLYFTPETKDAALMDTIEQVADRIKTTKNMNRRDTV